MPWWDRKRDEMGFRPPEHYFLKSAHEGSGDLAFITNFLGKKKNPVSPRFCKTVSDLLLTASTKQSLSHLETGLSGAEPRCR